MWTELFFKKYFIFKSIYNIWNASCNHVVSNFCSCLVRIRSSCWRAAVWRLCPCELQFDMTQKARPWPWAGRWLSNESSLRMEGWALCLTPSSTWARVWLSSTWMTQRWPCCRPCCLWAQVRERTPSFLLIYQKSAFVREISKLDQQQEAAIWNWMNVRFCSWSCLAVCYLHRQLPSMVTFLETRNRTQGSKLRIEP